MKFKLRNRGSRSSQASSASSSPGGSGRVEDPSAWLTKELTTTFKVFDKDGDGKISKSELGDVLRSLGDNLNDSELDDVVTRLGGTAGCINLEQFISFHTDSPSSSGRVLSRASSAGSGNEIHDPEMEALKSAFAVFDIDKNGFISAEELQRVMLTLGDKHTSLEECRHMIKCVDKDGNQMVDFGEFQCLMSGSSVLSF
ncbi:hypothetical protein M758_1G076300 [Ceratodon purpureus]|uniref:EF-hand domain-containing protein n=1 Tax=Ceratodon purpureus TaxID=3225 RepID=A0A8T0J4L4_CERPU|nr:hypothetical protein KC19_1G078200 [Ceratodon purpureus]KAG0629091.1 hypothetical protein M758_1G076300 [Ceratodon purpureus]